MGMANCRLADANRREPQLDVRRMERGMHVGRETFRLEQGSQPDVRSEEQFHAWSTSQFPGAAG